MQTRAKPSLWHPKYWPLFLLLIIFRLIVLFPYRWQLMLGRGFGNLAFVCSAKWHHVGSVNLKLCFPDLSDAEHMQRLRAAFQSVGMGVMEAFMAWFMSERRFQKIPFIWEGKAHYEAAHNADTGIILLSGHFNSLEVIGRAVSHHMNFGVVYKASRSVFFEYLLTIGRARYTSHAIKHVQVKAMISYLKKEKGTLWYGPDQDFGRDRSVFSPWFGIPTATLVGTSVLAKLGGARVLPAYFRRLPQGGYELTTLPVLENFPSGDEQADADRWQKLLEDYVRQYPDDYLWLYKRFKTRPLGESSVY